MFVQWINRGELPQTQSYIKMSTVFITEIILGIRHHVCMPNAVQIIFLDLVLFLKSKCWKVSLVGVNPVVSWVVNSLIIRYYFVLLSSLTSKSHVMKSKFVSQWKSRKWMLQGPSSLWLRSFTWWCVRSPSHRTRCREGDHERNWWG